MFNIQKALMPMFYFHQTRLVKEKIVYQAFLQVRKDEYSYNKNKCASLLVKSLSGSLLNSLTSSNYFLFFCGEGRL